MNYTRPKSAGALYYPYIHIRDMNWLRANLIIFPHIQRMLPFNYSPLDGDGIEEFTRCFGDKEPLLQPANIFTDRVIDAQRVLASKLKRDSESEDFKERFGIKAARSAKTNNYGFQIHVEKLSYELKNSLRDSQLAFDPEVPEPYDGNSEYIEVHPRVGEAVMSTIAVACAQNDGLDIIGDGRSGELHSCLLEKRLDEVYESWLDPNRHLDAPPKATGEELMEFILGVPGDLSVLTAEKLHELAEEREPIDDLIGALRTHAAQIPAMAPGTNREDRFKQVATEVMEKWEGDRRNLRGFAKEFFGIESNKLMTDFLSKSADKSLTGLATGATATAATGAAGAGWFGSLVAGGLIGAGAGLVIGLIAHAGTTYYRISQREKNSPYRFLTVLEKEGVISRPEFISGSEEKDEQ
jgi:hypothetical protein